MIIDTNIDQNIREEEFQGKIEIRKTVITVCAHGLMKSMMTGAFKTVLSSERKDNDSMTMKAIDL